MARTPSVALAAIILFGPAAARSPSGQAPTAFLVLLDSYRQGDRKQAVRTLLDWPQSQLAASLRSIENRAIACPSPCLRATLLLELEAAIEQRGRKNENAADFHLDRARKLAPRLIEEPGNEGFLRDWLLAAGLALRMEGRTLVPIDIFSECARRFESDAECQLALGTAYEARVFSSVPYAGAFGWQPSTAPVPNNARAGLQAKNAYERALRLVPELDEAHLRFGRFLQRRGEAKRAEQELTWVLEHSTTAHYRVLAHLFLGRMAENRERFRDAAAHYRAALQEQPTCQAARLALSHALLRAGQHREAMETARSTLHAPDEPEALESWLAYRLDAVNEFKRRMRSLTEQVHP